MNSSEFNSLLTAYSHALKVDTSSLKILPDSEVRMQTVTTLEFTVDVPKVGSLDSGLMIKVWQAKAAGDYVAVFEVFLKQLDYDKLNEFCKLDRSDQAEVIETWIGGHPTWKNGTGA